MSKGKERLGQGDRPTATVIVCTFNRIDWLKR